MPSHTQKEERKERSEGGGNGETEEKTTEEHCVAPGYPRDSFCGGDLVVGSSLRNAAGNSGEGVRGARLGIGTR